VETDHSIPDFVPDPGLAIKLVTTQELLQLIAAGEFSSQLHLGTLLLAQMNDLLDLNSRPSYFE
jgi:ADP-ribose pyrophosphatase